MANIFDPIKIGKMEVKNRIVRAPTLMSYCSPDGYVTNREIEHYRALAAGGVGLIEVGVHFLHPRGRIFGGRAGMGAASNRSMILDDTYIPGLKSLAEAIHEEGVKATVQICHTGKFSDAEVSSVPSEINPSILRPDQALKEMSLEEIDEEIVNYVQAAKRVKSAGFDGISLHGTHGLLFQQFMSPHTNVRTDKYGKDRMLFSVETIQRVRAEVGPDFPIIFRLSGDEFLDQAGLKGITVDDMKNMAPRLEAAGADCLHVTGGVPEVIWMSIQPSYLPRGCLLHLAEAVKNVVRIPVIGVGRINDPEVASKAIEDGKCDMIALSRGLIADPDFPKKMQEGRPEDINKCLACMHCLEHAGQGVECSVNANVGREEEYRIRRVSVGKKVLIAGGGPAGMEAARVSKLKGHDVTLYEMDGKLGGQLLTASVAPGKEEMKNVLDYLTTQMKKLNVKVVLGEKVTADVVKREKPDVVIMATGSSQFKPEVPGIEKPNVVLANDVLDGDVEVGKTVVVIGGELVGCEVADYLAEKGKKVTITRRGKEMATHMNQMSRILLIQRLAKGSVEMLTEVKKYEKITDEGLNIVDKEGRNRTIRADHVVIASGSRPNRGLFSEIRGLTREMIYEAGDCVEPRMLWNAIHEGSKVARML